jgi:Tfp pilus assembly protein PilX
VSGAATRRRLHDERGMALVLVILASVLLSALGGILVLETQTESTIASNYRDGIAAFYAAEAGAGVAMATLVTADRWSAQPAFVAGTIQDLLGLPTAGPPTLVRVSLIDAGATDRITIVSQADGPRQTRRTVRVTVARADPADRLSLRIVAWEEVR